MKAAGGDARSFACDVADVPTLTRLIGEAEARAGRIDILVNNAGIGHRRRPSRRSTRPPSTACWACTSRAASSRRGGRAGHEAAAVRQDRQHRVDRRHDRNRRRSDYSAAKAALLGLTKAWAKELAPFKINVNAVAPGGTMTEMVLSKLPTRAEALERIQKRLETGVVPLRRYAEPHEISYAVVFLASAESDFITGQVISPNGGEAIVGI